MVITVSPPEVQPLTSSVTAVARQGENRVALRGISWLSYQQILNALPQSRAARLTYDRGILEITMPLIKHEFSRCLIEVFIRILVMELGMKLKTMGSTTMDCEDLQRGAEPDCAYYIQNQPKVAGKTVDFSQDPPPDLVVEVDITHTDIDKNRLYASLGVPEFWRYNGQELKIYTLQESEQESQYVECDRSPTFPWMQKEYLYNFLEEAQQDEIAAEVKFRDFVKTNGTGLQPSTIS
ncbi:MULTISPECIES: Uma2 family endonuclease [Pseudanabaena]|jgi:Uma2 family endonuclease|uniref:Uma2 family endonuclease n=1 Tax=Pseudanabaena TaxID=1152 RepID=UPI00247AEA1A|nr:MULTISPECIES: Uma2 family endonuclease [Pseudanabaena]MEA5489396.1 Uma2 family endonuclease [Pseudanabaena sp. CCNP1317]WGS71874.1 Uma2 family endonuclease [Pseudanabaena galeata CCNP1313]